MTIPCNVVEDDQTTPDIDEMDTPPQGGGTNALIPPPSRGDPPYRGVPPGDPMGGPPPGGPPRGDPPLPGGVPPGGYPALLIKD